MAILDQERAGVDIISDGEMRRFYFVQSFYKRVSGIVEDPPLRKIGPYGYDSPPRYHTVEKISVPNGLGIVDEFKLHHRSHQEADQGNLSRPADAHNAHPPARGLQGPP